MRLQFDSETDYYEVLQVSAKAHPEIIKRAYRTLVAQLHAHPDLGGSHQQMVLINRAYEVLSNEELRAEYDRWRCERGLEPAPGPRPAAQTPRPVSPAAPPSGPAAGTIIATCPHCGRRNRVPQEVGLLRARCGNCTEPLLVATVRKQGAPRRGAAAHRLPQNLYQELCREGQLRVQLSRVARGSRVVCRLCGQPHWVAHAGRPPRTCPACGSAEWLNFRLFKCRHCGHEFETSDMQGWPYRFFPTCPGCGAGDWSRAAERSPLRWIMPLLARLAGRPSQRQ